VRAAFVVCAVIVTGSAFSQDILRQIEERRKEELISMATSSTHSGHVMHVGLGAAAPLPPNVPPHSAQARDSGVTRRLSISED